LECWGFCKEFIDCTYNKSGIKHPHKDSHKAKDGYQDCAVNSEAPTNQQILDAVNIAKRKGDD